MFHDAFNVTFCCEDHNPKQSNLMIGYVMKMGENTKKNLNASKFSIAIKIMPAIPNPIMTNLSIKKE